MEIAKTPKPPYFAVIFTSTLAAKTEAYQKTSAELEALAESYPGYLGFESAREEVGVFISYWKDLAAIQQWKANLTHLKAQEMGKTSWYKNYKVRIAKVERDYGNG
jgi:heme-degrading monooxygenase HmoA